MNLARKVRRMRQRLCLAPEVLEDRVVLSAGQGSTFAIMPGSVTTAGQVSTLNFTMSSAMFATPKRNGDILLGIDIASATASSSSSTSTLKPEIVSVKSASGKMIPVQHSKYDAKVAKANKLGDSKTSAILVTLKVPKGTATASYSVQVEGLQGTTGSYLVGFYLPGDVTGTGQVTQADLKVIKEDKGMTAESSNYNFDADVNRDGIINSRTISSPRKTWVPRRRSVQSSR